MKKKWIQVFSIICFCLLSLALTPLNASAATPFDDPVLATYKGPNGISIVSRNPAWSSQTVLKSVWDELMRNTHYNEITSLKRINILRGNYVSYYKGGVVTWSDGHKEWSNDCEINYFPDTTENDPNDMPSTLSHEYGHHFTMYYLFKKEKIDLEENWRQSKYAKIRGLTNNPKVSTSSGTAHEWMPQEIAANDYEELFGSPNARKLLRFNGHWSETVYSTTFNVSPQENTALPLAAQVPGLYQYWLSLAGRPVSSINKAPTTPSIALTAVESHFFSQNFTLQWSKAYDDKNKPITYTVLEYQSPSDRLGYPIASNYDIYEAQLPIYNSEARTIWVRVLACDSEGLIVQSNILAINLDNPIIQNAPSQGINPYAPKELLWDVPTQYWAYNAIKTATAKNLISGYPDKSFRPNGNITRAEFAVILCKYLNIPVVASENSDFKDVTTHWAKGYINAVYEKGFMTGYLDGTFGPNKSITRAEAAVIMCKALNLQQNGLQPNLSDVNTHWAKSQIEIAVENNIFKGYPDNTFRPQNKLSRAETAILFTNE